MTPEECSREKDQLMKIKGLEVSDIGFVCTGGFNFRNTEGFILVDGEELYQET